MSINKNFVVKNGFEVNTNLILADATTKRVGIASTVPAYTLDVRGGIGATDIRVSGIATIINELRVGASGTVFSVVANPGVGQSVGVGTAKPGFLLDIRSPVSTGQTALYVQGDVKVTGNINLDGDINIDEINTRNLNVSGLSTFVGLSTFNDYVVVQDGLVVTGTGATLTTLNVSGVSTFTGFTTVTNLNAQNINNSGIVTTNSLNIGATQIISSARQLQNIASLDATTTATIEAAIANGPNTFTDLKVTGVSTFVGLATFNDGLRVVSGITTLGVTTATNITAQQLNISGFSTFSGVTTHTTSLFGTQASFSGVVTATSFVGSGASLTGNARNLTATIGIGTSGSVVGYGVSFLDLRGPGLSTVYYNNNVGIATIFFQGGGTGGGASIGIGSTPGDAGFIAGIVTTGNLWYNSNIGRLFIYYTDPDGSQWVDAAPFNVGVITSLTNVSFAAGSASSPSMYFIGDNQTGFFSPAAGQFTVVSTGSSILNINSSGINVTGKITCTNGAIFSGVVTSTTFNGQINAGVSTFTGISTFQSSLFGTQASFSGVVTATDFNSLSDIKYKENVNTVNNALLKVEQLRGVKFDWKESGLPSYGIIAQELEEVLPELVHGNDPKTVNYNGIIGVLIEAIKELKAEVEELKNTK